uniref:RdRp n=1 Tax=viral metagenome TaxID=1070528 RepID=A0A2V0RBH0_9ZZZZ
MNKIKNISKIKGVLVSAFKNSKLESCQSESGLRLEEFESFIDTYATKFMKTLSHNGKDYTLELYKAIHDQSIRLVTREEWSPIPFHKSNKEGVSSILVPILHHLRGVNYKDIRLILSVTRFYESIRSEPVLDLDPIVTVYNGTRDLDEFDTEFQAFLSESKVTRTLKSHLPVYRKSETLIGRIRSGPNGQAIITSHYDALAVIEDSKLHQNMTKFNTLLSQDFITQHMNWCGAEASDLNIGKVETGKISLASERAGKTRLFGIVDYWSQNSLQSLHDWLMKILKSLPCDTTFNQNKGFERILSKQVGWMVSYDISKFTDRVPLKLQTTMLSYYTSHDLAQCWEGIVGNRTFYSKKGRVKWKVGQPLGALSSWATCTLLHHHLIWLASYRFFGDHRPFKGYQMLGDDIVIWHRGVGKVYADLLNEIGVEINMSKSKLYNNFEEKKPIFEFAKRLGVNGNEISGIPFDLLEKSAQSIYTFTELINFLVETKLITEVSRDLALPDKLSPKGKLFLEVLLWERKLGRPSWLESRFGNACEELTLLNAIRIEVAKVRLEGLSELIGKLDELVYSSNLEDNLRQAGVAYSDMLIGYSSNFYHPIIYALNHVGMKMYDTLPLLESMTEYVESTEELELPELTKVEYLPLPYQNAYFERPGKRNPERLRKHSQLVLTAFNRLKSTRNGFLIF